MSVTSVTNERGRIKSKKSKDELKDPESIKKILSAAIEAGIISSKEIKEIFKEILEEQMQNNREKKEKINKNYGVKL